MKILSSRRGNTYKVEYGFGLSPVASKLNGDASIIDRHRKIGDRQKFVHLCRDIVDDGLTFNGNMMRSLAITRIATG